MAPVIINGMQLSAPCRIVQMACEVAGVEYELKLLDLFKVPSVQEVVTHFI